MYSYETGIDQSRFSITTREALTEEIKFIISFDSWMCLGLSDETQAPK